MRTVQPLYVPLLPQDPPESGRLILRDGSTARVRVVRPGDVAALKAFIGRLSPESRRRRFFAVSDTAFEHVERIARATDPRETLTLVVLRGPKEDPRVIALGSYLVTGDETAEVAMVVEDAFQGKGLGTLLLERLALLAVRHGIRRFHAVTHPDNQPMLDVFRHSGFAVTERLEHGYVLVDLSVLPSEASVARSELRDRVLSAASLRPFFRPRAVAVVGASRDPASIGYRILEALVVNGFQGPVYPVNPKAAVVGSIRAYPSVRELPEPVDLAVLAVPREAVLDVVDDCAARGVRALVVITAGFAETGAEGRRLQQALVDKVRGHGLRMVGPNCLGLLNTDPAVRLNASFSPVFPPAGRVAMSSQSGALGLAILAFAESLNLGLSTFVSVGNKADVSGNDLIQYWEEDENTDVILLYLESFGNPRRFARIARRVTRRKPIVAVKSGRTLAGHRAAGSHTAALAASDAAVEALFHQTGVIRADTLEDMFDLAAALANQPLPPGRRVGVVTNAGGPAILCTDACEAAGLQVPELAAATRQALASFLPPAASVTNPVDMIASASPDQYRQAIAALLAAEELDALVVIFIPVGMARPTAVARAVLDGVREGRSRGGAGKPVLACFMSEHGAGKSLAEAGERIPSYRFPEAAAHVLAKVARYAEWRRQPPGIIPDFPDIRPDTARHICERALAERGGGWLRYDEAHALLAAFGLPVPPGGLARTAAEAAALARKVGLPVAVKLASTTLVHKTELGGVRLGLESEAAVKEAFAAIEERLAREGRAEEMDGVIVQPMIEGGTELMVGMTEDPSFGPLVAFGLGGVHVEILQDVAFRVTPLTDRDAREMVASIRGYRLLQGYRGHPPADVEAVQEVLLRVSRLVEEVPFVAELDLNPVFALAPGQGCRIADVRIRVEPQTVKGPLRYVLTGEKGGTGAAGPPPA